MIFDTDKFKYIDHTLKDSGVREIIALAKYNGKTFRGYARCHPEDTFDFEIGKEIAARRCDLAIRRARLKDRIAAQDAAAEAYVAALRLAQITDNKVEKAEEEYFTALDHYDAYMTGI